MRTSLTDAFGPGGKWRIFVRPTLKTYGQTLPRRIGRLHFSTTSAGARVVFNYALNKHLIQTPIRYGDSFDKPSRKDLRKARQGKPPRMFQADEVRKIIDKAGVTLRAMVYLGINCGLGNNDCAMLPIKALDLKAGWLNYAEGQNVGIPSLPTLAGNR